MFVLSDPAHQTLSDRQAGLGGAHLQNGSALSVGVQGWPVRPSGLLPPVPTA